MWGFGDKLKYLTVERMYEVWVDRKNMEGFPYEYDGKTKYDYPILIKKGNEDLII